MNFKPAEKWFASQDWEVFSFQRSAWQHFEAGYNGIINAPTGSGKTYALIIPILLALQKNGEKKAIPRGLQAIWITPIRALSKEIKQATERAANALHIDIDIAIRTGDSSTKEKARIKKSPPHILITTPETLHLLLAQKGYPTFFQNLSTIVMDEWHELVGSKRGVQIELALSRLKSIGNGLNIWGISATIGNMDESMKVLLGDWYDTKPTTIIKSDIKKKYVVESIFPDKLETLPWSGHLGIRLMDKVIPILLKSESTLIFLNTRGQAEIWYQKLLEHSPDFSGVVALHHGSMSRETRHWVEDALYDGRLKVVICTSSLDLGVDFRPVETIIQVGSPKGVSRFKQRAGRSGHQPGATSKIYFLPTHSLELIEASALREAIELELAESRMPYMRSFDVLVQYLVTLAVSESFLPAKILPEIRSTFCYSSISDDEWLRCLNFIVFGGNTLSNYDEFHKVIIEDGVYKVTSKRVALRHRLSIGTIVSDAMLKVKMQRGGYLGNIEESFIARINPGDSFWFAGRSLELIRLHGMTVEVRKSKKESGPIPSWMGGRMPLSSQMSKMLRKKLNEAVKGIGKDPEVAFLKPLIDRQQTDSIVPREDQFLIEMYETKDGYHALFFPFEGRFVHEGLAALIAYRISLLQPISFSIAMNDYGFELLSDQPIPIQSALDTNILSTEHLMDDILASINSVEMAKRQFRDIASISGLVFQGYPNRQKKERHLQASSQLFFSVFEDFENDNLLLRQAYDEVMDFQLEEARMRQALERIAHQEIVVTTPPRFTPFAFPIIVDRLREKLTSEKLADRIQKMKIEL